MIERTTSSFGHIFLALAISGAASAPAMAQTHKVAKPENVVRAVGVYEWTGDMAKPTAARLIPVSLFIDGKLEDAAVYLARPVPFALQTGNVYELDQAGIPHGLLDLIYSRHFEPSGTAATTYDDGWFGYGKFVPPVQPKVSTLKPSKTLAIVNSTEDDPSKPHFSTKSAKPDPGDAAHPAPDTSSSGTPAADPERPTMKRHADPSDSKASTGPSRTDETPADDPDRPTLRRRTPEEAKKVKGDQPSVTGGGDSLNNDPNRPTLHRGKPAGVTAELDFPKLSGLPGDQDLHQMIAVSDAANRLPHDFSRPWDDEAEHQAVLAKMQAAARVQLAAYESANGAKPTSPPPPDTRLPNSKLRRGVAHEQSQTPAPLPSSPGPMLDEQLKAYTLSYGGAATYVYSAHTDGPGAAQRFITLVAQVNMQGQPEIAMKSVTDAAHLDRTPRMRLVDAVDAEASNRASLLFELREQNARQFALYRVLGARADQTFLTGTTQ